MIRIIEELYNLLENHDVTLFDEFIIEQQIGKYCAI